MKAFEVMTAKVYDQKRVENWKHYRAETKLDGVRVICTVNGKGVKFFSRNGRELEMFGHLTADMKKMASIIAGRNKGYDYGVMFDGEMCCPTFNEIGGAIHRKDHTEEKATFFIFHCMPLKLFEAGLDDAPQRVRRDQLINAIGTVLAGNRNTAAFLMVSLPVKDDAHLSSLYKEAIRMKREGLMLKNMEHHWAAKRSHSWMKLKQADTVDVPIVGWKPGKGKYEGTLGALIVDHKGKEVRVSGMNDTMRDALFEKRKKLMSGTMIAEIEYQLITQAGSLRHPRFIRLRPDKEKLK